MNITHAGKTTNVETEQELRDYVDAEKYIERLLAGLRQMEREQEQERAAARRSRKGA